MVEQEDQRCDQQTEAQHDEALCVGGDRAGGGPGHVEQPAPAEVAPLVVAGRPSCRPSPRAADELRRTADVRVKQVQGQRSTPDEQRLDQRRPVKRRGDEAGDRRATLRDRRQRRAAPVHRRTDGNQRAADPGRRRHDERTGVGHGTDKRRVWVAADDRQHRRAVIEQRRKQARRRRRADGGPRQAVHRATAGGDDLEAAAEPRAKRRVGRGLAAKRGEP